MCAIATPPAGAITRVLVDEYDADIATLAPLSGGLRVQAYAFSTNSGQQRVVRLRDSMTPFLLDRYCARAFSRELPIPAILAIGEYAPAQYYCVSERAQGELWWQAGRTDNESIIASIEGTLARLAGMDLDSSSGYGAIDPLTGNGTHKSWRNAFEKQIESDDRESPARMRQWHALGLAKVYRRCREIIHRGLERLPEHRHLIHGDLRLANLLVDHNRVTAILDWEAASYGDWLYDFAYLKLWHPDSLPCTAEEFALKHKLPKNGLQARFDAYSAHLTASGMNFSIDMDLTEPIEWLRTRICNRYM